MGHLKHIHSNLDIQAFPGAHFEIVAEVPAAQCTEAKIEGTEGQTDDDDFFLKDTGAFAGFNLTNKILTITAPDANAGDRQITNNTDDRVNFLIKTPLYTYLNIYYVHDGGSLILTRSAASFFRFIHAYNTLADFTGADVENGQAWIHKAAAFTEDFTNSTALLPGAPPPHNGPHLILSNDADHLHTDHTFPWTLGDLELRITRPDKAAGTIKGGKLYTDMPSDQLKNACTILFDPLT